jgi:hypothetical protein
VIAAGIEGEIADRESLITAVVAGAHGLERAARVEVGDGVVVGGQVEVAPRGHQRVGDAGRSVSVLVGEGLVDVFKTAAEIGDAVGRSLRRQRVRGVSAGVGKLAHVPRASVITEGRPTVAEVFQRAEIHRVGS